MKLYLAVYEWERRICLASDGKTVYSAGFDPDRVLSRLQKLFPTFGSSGIRPNRQRSFDNWRNIFRESEKFSMSPSICGEPGFSSGCGTKSERFPTVKPKPMEALPKLRGISAFPGLWAGRSEPIPFP
jgi:hypothetical protein